MSQIAWQENIRVAPVDLERVQGLYESGKYLQAYRAARTLGPLERWSGSRAKVLAGRLAMNLGAPRLGRRLHISAWRQASRMLNREAAATGRQPGTVAVGSVLDNPGMSGLAEAGYYYARVLLERRGPLRAWHFVRHLSSPVPVICDSSGGEMEENGEKPEIRASWLALHASILCLFRDFDRADSWMRQAEGIGSADPWIAVERASLLRAEDRYEEALEAANRSLELKHWYPPGIQAAADLLVLLNRDQEALGLLLEAAEEIESASALAQLAVLQTELGLHTDARQSFQRFAELSPLLEKEGAHWLAARRADIAYYLGDSTEAVEWAGKAEEASYTNFAQALANSAEDGRRLQLDVGFVRQHHLTCVPATLAAISRFWNMPVQHLEVAEAICYDGTPDHRERHWAEEHGWQAREFTVTWDSARALIDRGLPFTLTTTEPADSHLQAVIGYDTRRGTLLIRDPSERQVGEFDCQTLLQRYQSSGPRGMVLVPRDRADLLDGALQLPDASQYDQLHQLQRALEEHNRNQAAQIFAEMKKAALRHRLTRHARWLLAHYDCDPTEVLASLEELLELFPNDALLLRAKLTALTSLARREDRLRLLAQIGLARDSDPVFWQLYAQELAADARDHDLAVFLLRRAIRCRPFESGNLAVLANIRLSQRRFDEALELFRFAACLNMTDESSACSYFSTARLLKQTETALEFLQQRFERYGTRSGNPARTLFWALSQLERVPEAFLVLEQALVLRPEDGDLMTFAAEQWGLYGSLEEAEQLQTRAEGHCARAKWLKSAATLAGTRGDLAGALNLWRQVAEAEPLNLEAHRAIARLLAETDRLEACLEYLRQACDRFPHNYPLHQLWIEWLRVEAQKGNIQAAIEQMRELVGRDPNYYWGWHTLTEWLREAGHPVDYLEAASQLVRLAPESANSYGFRGEAKLRMGDRADAKEDLQRALALDPSFEFGWNLLFDLQLADKEYEGAAKTLEIIRQAGNQQEAFAREVRLAVKRRDQEKALEFLRTLCERAEGPSRPLESAVAAMVKADRGGAVERVLETALTAQTVHPSVGGLWVERCTARGSWRCRKRLPELVARGEIGRHALVAYAKALADRKRWLRQIRLSRLVSCHQGFLRETAMAWGGIAYAFTRAADYRKALTWMSDWRARPDAEPWMLSNLALSLRALGRTKEANQVSRHALTLKEDGTSPVHKLWLAFDDALAHETQSAKGRLAAISVGSLDTCYQFLWTLVDVMVSVQQAGATGRHSAFAWGRNKLSKAWRAWRKENFRSFRASYRLGVRRIAGDCGGFVARLWGLWRWLHPLVPGA